MRNRRSIAAVFRVIAGGYLIYLGVQLIRDGLLTGSMQGNARILGILASALFIVFGAFFAIHAIVFMTKNSGQEEEEQNGENAEEETVQEEVQAPSVPSLFDRAGMGAGLDDDEEDETEI